MIPRAALLSHERLCPDCGGDKRVMREVPTSLDGIAAEPRWEEIDCPTCDGTGVKADERRHRERNSYDDASTRLINLITASRDEWKARAEHAERQTDCLLVETRRLERVVHEQAKALDESDHKGPRDTREEMTQ